MINKKCVICGKFISLTKDKYVITVYPDSDYSKEEITYTHNLCNFLED